jgi:rhodanese-related sulfurtransferase
MRNQPYPERSKGLWPSDWQGGSRFNTDRVESWEMTPRELARRLDLGEPIVLVDVRERWEIDIVSLPGSRFIPLNELRYRAAEEIDPEDDVVLVCHHGASSLEAALHLWELGYDKVRSLAGGIDRWALEVDPSLRRY